MKQIYDSTLWNGFLQEIFTVCKTKEDAQQQANAVQPFHTGSAVNIITVFEDETRLIIEVETGYEFHGWRRKLYAFIVDPDATVHDEWDDEIGERAVWCVTSVDRAAIAAR